MHLAENGKVERPTYRTGRDAASVVEPMLIPVSRLRVALKEEVSHHRLKLLTCVKKHLQLHVI